MTAQSCCPCGNLESYQNCCGLYHSGTPAPTAEALMRSRYTAYYKGNILYLLETLHPSKRKFDDRINLIKSVNATSWQRLKVIDTSQGQETDQLGYVEFMAVYRSDNKLGQLHERSRFVKEDGRWFYVEGTLMSPWRPKRNDPCWCGSGKKFKQCHS